MEVKKELSDREFIAWCRFNVSAMNRDDVDRFKSLTSAWVEHDAWERLSDLAELRLDLAEAREDTARLKLSREAIDGALDRLDVDGDCFDFEGLTNHLRQALAAIDEARGKA